MDLISVIVPVYKVEKYLDRCIESIVNQTYRNLEIILVDDGSPDRCGEICDQWAERDERIRVIHQKNAGGAAARNVALNIAKGNLIAFVDSDDYISLDMYAHLYELINQGADIAECNHLIVLDSNEAFDQHGCREISTFTTQKAMEKHICDQVFRQLIWDKLYRREVIGDIHFPVGKKIDDEFFTYQVLGKAKVLIRSEKICYAYRQQEDSVMHAISLRHRLQAVEAKVQRHEYVQEHFPILTELSLKNLWFTCIYQGQLALMETKKDAAKRAVSYLRGILKKYPYKAREATVKEKIWIYLAKISLDTVCRLRNWLKLGL